MEELLTTETDKEAVLEALQMDQKQIRALRRKARIAARAGKPIPRKKEIVCYLSDVEYLNVSVYCKKMKLKKSEFLRELVNNFIIKGTIK